MEKNCFVFWKRIFAFVIDYLVVWAICYNIANRMFYNLVELGNWTILLGFLIFILYFGIQNSKLCKGQTLGKRLFKIDVVDRNNNFLPLYKSIFRTIILSVCLFFPCRIYLFSYESILNYFILDLSAIFLLSSILLFVFNTPTRQTLPDILIKSFVKNKNMKIGEEIPDYVPVKFYLGVQRVSTRLSTFNFRIPTIIIKVSIITLSTIIMSFLAYFSYASSISYRYIIDNIQKDLKNIDKDYKLTYISDNSQIDYALPRNYYDLIIEVTINKKDISDDIDILKLKIPYIVNKQIQNNNYGTIFLYVEHQVNLVIYKKFFYKMYEINNKKTIL